MTSEKKEKFQRQFPTWLTLTNLVLLIAIGRVLYSAGEDDTQIKANIKANYDSIQHISQEIGIHVNSRIDHKQMENLMIQFVPRIELEGDLDAIQKGQDEIKDLIRDNHKPK